MRALLKALHIDADVRSAVFHTTLMQRVFTLQGCGEFPARVPGRLVLQLTVPGHSAGRRRRQQVQLSLPVSGLPPQAMACSAA